MKTFKSYRFRSLPSEAQTAVLLQHGGNLRYAWNKLVEFSNAVNKETNSSLLLQVGVVDSSQKPVELLEYLINTYTNENDVVLDCFAGSGTTLVSAKALNRQFIGIEKEQEYYDICLERLK